MFTVVEDEQNTASVQRLGQCVHGVLPHPDVHADGGGHCLCHGVAPAEVGQLRTVRTVREPGGHFTGDSPGQPGLSHPAGPYQRHQSAPFQQCGACGQFAFTEHAPS